MLIDYDKCEELLNKGEYIEVVQLIFTNQIAEKNNNIDYRTLK